MIEQCQLRRVTRGFDLLQPLPRQFAIVVITKAVRDLLIVSVGGGSITVFFRQSPPPVQRGGNLRRRWIQRNLLFEFMLGIGITPHAQA